jgi:hypothetical protein
LYAAVKRKYYDVVYEIISDQVRDVAVDTKMTTHLCCAVRFSGPDALHDWLVSNDSYIVVI